MSLKKVILATLILTLLGRGSSRAQSPGGPPGDAGGAVVPDAQGGAPPVVGSYHGPAGLSPWLVGADRDCDCCGPLSDRNPMKTELFIRSGWTIPSGDGVLAHALSSGFAIEGGGRQLFFNRLGDAAWTIETSLSNFNNPGRDPGATVLLHNVPFNLIQAGQNAGTQPEANVSVRTRSLNRTYVSLGGGREWYLLGGAAGTRDSCPPARWRFGVDGGGRWGTSKLQIDNINAIGETQAVVPQKNHRTDTIGAVYAAIHTDVDIPCGGCCIFQVGLRAEVDYTWSDILQIQNKADLISTNLMLNLGVRY